MNKNEIDLLLKTGETANVEFKGPMSFSDDNRHELAKDIIAMANTQDGGTIIIGIEDKTNAIIGLTEEQVRSFDVTKINDFVRKYSSPLVKLQCVPATYADKYILVIIRVAEFESQPVIAKNCDSSKSKPVFREADILIRTEAAKSEPIREESSMRRLLSLALRKRSNELLKEISLIISDSNPKNPQETEGDEVTWQTTNEYFRNALTLENEQRTNIGTWSFSCHPVSAKIGNIVPNHAQLRELLDQTSVKLSSIHFPRVIKGYLKNLSFNVGNANILFVRQDPAPELYREEFLESYALTGNLMYFAKRYMREDYEGAQEQEDYIGQKQPNSPRFNFLWAIFQVGSFCEFVTRYFQSVDYEGEIVLRIMLSRTRNRRLFVEPRFLHLNLVNTTCLQDQIHLERRIFPANLMANHRGIALDLLRILFAHFQYNENSDRIILKELDDLHNGKIM